MPLVKRTVTPTHLCRQKIPRGLTNELECVTNNTLSGVINQLASLSQHAEDIFGELFTEANTFYGRASQLKDRIDNLSVKVTQLDSNVEEVSLIDINSRKAFKSSVTTDQQVVSRQSLSRSVFDTYKKADAPPPLQELNQFRDDDRDGLKIYTDPDYFFDLWREAIQKETREAREKRREQRKRDRKANPNYRKPEKVRQAVNTRKMQAERMKHGVEFIKQTSNQPTNVSQRRPSSGGKKIQRDSSFIQEQKNAPDQYPNHFPPAPPIENNVSSFPEPPPMTDNIPPPPEPMYHPNIPPPPQPTITSPPMMSPPTPPAPYLMNGDAVPAAPPMNVPPPPPMSAVPPPPPPPAMDIPQAPAQSGLAAALQNVSLKKAEPEPVSDGRGNLLEAIRLGINLRKVEQNELSAAVPASGGNDVASILARRIAVEYSDSDESDSTLASDDDDWGD